MDDVEFDVYYQVPVPKNGTPRDLSLTPITISVVDTIGLVKSRKLLKVLLDPGSSGTMIKESILPKEARPVSLSRDKTIKTVAGKIETNRMVHLRNIKLPEFDKNRKQPFFQYQWKPRNSGNQTKKKLVQHWLVHRFSASE